MIFILLAAFLLANTATRAGAIDVIRQQVFFEQDYTVAVNIDVEYVLEFIPSGEQAQFPSRLSASAAGGDISRPLLLTARQTTGAQTWQLPYRTPDGSDLLYTMQRTLCFNASQSGSSASGQFTLHVSSSSATNVTVIARADPLRDWQLNFGVETEFDISLTAPRAFHYRFATGQDRVLLVVASEDNVCAIVGVQNYTCPVAELADTITSAGYHMTVQRSGGVQVSRRQFPEGFYVVALVKASDEVCNGEPEVDPDWLWEAVVGGDDVTTTAPSVTNREKRLTVTVQAALTRTQYAVAVGVTFAIFLLFYAAFLGLVFSQRFDVVRKYVGPKAVLASEGIETMVDATTQRRRRRDSDATFDSVDDDSESEPEDHHNTTINPPPRTPPTATDNNDFSTEGIDNIDTSTANDAKAKNYFKENTSPTATDNNGFSAEGIDNIHTSTAHDAKAKNYSRENIDPNRNGSELIAVTNQNGEGNSAKNETDSINVRNSEDVTRYDVLETDGVASNINSEETETPVTEVDATQPADREHGNMDHVQNEVTQIQPGSAIPNAEISSPFGLPPQLRVAALARHRERTLKARSNRYLQTLYTVALFYTLPVVQFVAAFQIVLNVSGSLDLCYYNFLCAHPLGLVSDFNHVFSNAGYLLLGALFVLQVRRRAHRRKVKPRRQGYGIPAHYGLLSSLGAGMMVVALLSASYHVCPNALNFQFDTSFMYVLCVVATVKMYQARHPDINARAHATFAVLAVLIAFVVWGVLGGGPLFWGVWTLLHIFTFLLLSLRIYYIGQFTLDSEGLVAAARGLAKPMYVPRLVMLLIANALNWAWALYGMITMPADFATHLLFMLLMNALLYMVFYLTMKIVVGERLRWYSWAFTVTAAAVWAPALYFFVSGSTSWSATPAQSRHLNHECHLLNFYDNHDLWHMLSALALYLTFNAMLTWDDGLSAVKRTDIAVF